MNILTQHFGLDTRNYTTREIVSKVPLILRNTPTHTADIVILLQWNEFIQTKKYSSN